MSMPTRETSLSDSLIRIPIPFPLTRSGASVDHGATAMIVVDVAALERDLRQGIKGEVRFDRGDRGMYASDAGNYRMVPIGVVLPMDIDDVLHTTAVCRSYGAPIVARGGGTGIPGQTVNAAVVVDFSKYMNRIVEINAEQHYARVQPGTV